ncbi:hypothetical protein VST7929_02846 [Vibrio stylophorae]|uniref:Chromosome partitioning protein ParA n=1 Tax=Vibrio stylophorae TaxID=659351 RepID=A0ABN8E1D7_9VIBR|nr:restriction endonuclease subunit S [Vibrio stylophorae]CAH0535185.1 hypothetical protein VST7929_02846 [Vibrio stylophorae]
MKSFEDELKALEMSDEPEVALPSLDEQRTIVEKLKALEAKGELTPEVLEAHFAQFYAENDAPVH